MALAFDPRDPFTSLTAVIDVPLGLSLDTIVGNGLALAGEWMIPLATLAFAFFGIAIAQGWKQAPAQGFGILVAKVVFALVLVSAAGYASFVRDIFTQAMPQDISRLVAVGGQVATNSNAYDVLVGKAFAAGLVIWNSMSMLNPLKLVVIVYWACAAAAVLAGYGVWLLGYVLVRLYIAVGPIVIPTLLFSPTRAIFSAWCGCLMSSVMLQALSIILSTVLILAESQMVASVVTNPNGDGMTMLATIFGAGLVFCLCAWLGKKLPAAAVSLCGGIHFAPNAILDATYGAVTSRAGRMLGNTAQSARQAPERARAALRPPSAPPPGPSLSRSPAYAPR